MNIRILESRPVARRLVSGFGANMLGKIWALLIQFLQVPVLTAAWGGNGYGVWLMIVTVPTFIALSDFGLGTAAGVDMTRAISRGDYTSALRVYQSVWIFLTCVTATICVIVITGICIWLNFFNEGDDSIATGFTKEQIAVSAAICVAYAFVTMQASIQKIVFQATHKYAMGTFLNDIWFLIGGLGVICVGLLKGGIVAAAVVLLSTRVLGAIVTTASLRRSESWAKQGWSYAERTTLARLMRPSLAALSLTLANSVGLQGVVLTIGWFIGPAAAASFGTCRMLTRIPLQFSGLVVRASLPELIRAQESKNRGLTRRLMRINVGLSVAVVAPFAVALTLLGQTILTHISHGELSAPPLTFALLGLAATLSAGWASLGNLLLAENRQASYGYLAVVVYAACALSPALFRISMTPTLVVQCLAEALILLQVIRASSNAQRK
jgi:O-antigen/teichoic acid export membrane protein